MLFLLAENIILRLVKSMLFSVTLVTNLETITLPPRYDITT